jgi:predicted HicB family RNase H-like nuclease
MKTTYKTIRVRLPATQHQQIMNYKESTGVSLNHFVRIAVEDRIKKVKHSKAQ